MGKGTAGWVSTILGVGAAFTPAGWALAAYTPYMIGGAIVAGVIENNYQTRKLRAMFGKTGDSNFSGSPSYSWESPQTVSNPSIPVPLIFGTAATGGNIINSWTETINVYQTKWDIITPLNQSQSGYVNTFTTDTTSRGVKVDVPMLAAPGRSFKLYFRYKKTGDVTWIDGGTTQKIWNNYYAGESSPGDDAGVNVIRTFTIINPENYLNEFQWDIEIRVAERETSQDGLSGGKFWKVVYSAHENTADTNNIAGSKDYQYVVLGLAKGEISGFRQKKLNDNPIDNYSHDFFLEDYRFGTNEQPPVEWADKVVTETATNYKLLYNEINPPSGHETQNDNVSEIVLVFSFPSGLYQIDSKGQYQPWEVTVNAEYSKYSGTGWGSWTRLAATDRKIAGKNINPFKNAVKYSLEAGRYKIRVTKSSFDPAPTGTPATVGDVWWSIMQEYVTEPLSYPNTAIAAYRILASDAMSGSTPQFYFEIDGLLVDVPKLTISGNTVEYETTYWDGSTYKLLSDNSVCTDTGTFIKQWTRNPIWHVRHLCLSTDGLGDYVTSMTDSELRILAKYCDERVADGAGLGELEKRFVLDGILDTQNDARNWLETILQHFRGFFVSSENKIKLRIYKPENPVHIFTMGNIIENSLVINYASAQDKFNAVRVQYADEKNEYKLTDVYIYDTSSTKPTKVQEVNLPMITRRSGAVRIGKFLLNKNKYITETIQFSAALDAMPCEAGDIISFAHDVTGYGLASGRIAASTINSVTLDKQVTIGAGVHKIQVKLTDDSIEERTISNGAGTYYTVSVTSNFTSIPPVDSHYSIGESGKVTKPYRVVNITRGANQERKIIAVEENTSIYDDSGDNITQVVYSSLKNPLAMPEPVVNLTAKEITYDPGDGTKINTVMVSWRPPPLIKDPDIKPTVTTAATGGSISANTYYVKYTWVGSGGETMPSPVESIATTGSSSTVTVTVNNFASNATSVRVYAGTTSGQEKYQGVITASSNSIVLTAIDTTSSLIPVLSTVNENTSYDKGKVYISENDGVSWELMGEGKTTLTIPNLNKNVTYKIAVASVSQYGITQPIIYATKVVLNLGGDLTPPANTTFVDANYSTTTASTYLTDSPQASQNTTSDDWNYIYDIKLRWNAVTDLDLAGYEIRTEDANWGISNGNLIYRGLSTYFLFANPTNSTYAFYVKAFDSSGNYAVTAGSITINNSTPVLSDVYLDFTGKDCKLWWQDVQDEDFLGYQVHVYSDSARTNRVRLDNPTSPTYRYTYEMNLQDSGYPGIRDIYFTVKALDAAGQESAKDVAAHNDAPDAPTGMSTLNLFGGVYLQWSEVTDPDIKGYNIYVDGLFVAYTSDTNYRHNGTENVTYNYYIKSVDTFGEGGQSLTFQGTPFGAVVDITPPAIPTGLSATSINTIMTDGTSVSSITATWTANTELDLAGYYVRIKEGTGGNWIEFGAVTNSYTWASGIKAGLTYYINVRAYDSSYNKSGWMAVDYERIAAADTTPPAACSGLQAVGGFGFIALTWTNAAENKDIAYVEVHRSNTNNRANVDKIYKTYSNWFHDDAEEYLNNPTSGQLSQSGITSFNSSLVCNGIAGDSAWHTDSSTPGAYIRVDLGVAGDRGYVRAKIYAVGANNGKYMVEYSDDDSAYTAVTTAGNGLNVSGGTGWKEVSWDNAGNHRYWRLKLENTPGSGSWLGELELYDTARYYWVRPVDTSGNPSTFFPVSETGGITASSALLNADNLITAGAVITRSAMIKDAVITNAHIIELYADKISAGNIDTNRMSVNAGNAVNGGSVQISPGKILISGTTTLSDWRHGSDTTQIDGGDIYASSVTSNKLSIGSRNIKITGLTFTANSPSTNQVSWANGIITYVDDTDTELVRSITGTYATWTAQTVYVYYVRNATSLSTTTDKVVAHGADNIVLATYAGGTSLVVTFGTTNIDHAGIITNSITAGSIFATSLESISANLGTITAGLINSVARNNNFWNLDATTGTVFSLGNSQQTLRVEANGSGALGNNKVTWDASGNIVIDGTVTIGGSVAAKLDMLKDFEETWEPATNLSRWTNYSGGGELYVATTGGWNGSNFLQVGSNNGTDGAWLIHNENIPFDPSKLYKITVIVWRVYGTGTFFAGFAGVGDNGASFVNADGLNNYSSQHYCINDVSPPSAWTTYVGYIKGYGATDGYEGDGTLANPRKMHPSVRYFRPLMIANYSNVMGRTDISSITVKDATSELAWSGVTGTGKPADNADVTSANTAANTAYVGSTAAGIIAGWQYGSTAFIDGGDIYASTVTADKITTASLSAISATLGNVSAGNIVASSFRTSTGANDKRIDINYFSANELSFFGDNGVGTVEKLASIGISTGVYDTIIGSFGSISATLTGVESLGNKVGATIYGYNVKTGSVSNIVTGITGYVPNDPIMSSNSRSAGIGVYGEAVYGVGGKFYGGKGSITLTSAATSYSGLSATAPLYTIARVNGLLYDNQNTGYWRAIPAGVFGSAYGDGTTTPKRGTGFTVTREGVGDYTVAFTDAFADTPVVVATVYLLNVNITDRTIVVRNETESSFRAIIRGGSDQTTAVDSDFNFFAIAV